MAWTLGGVTSRAVWAPERSQEPQTSVVGLLLRGTGWSRMPVVLVVVVVVVQGWLCMGVLQASMKEVVTPTMGLCGVRAAAGQLGAMPQPKVMAAAATQWMLCMTTQASLTS
jgi:hypothetical protein